MGRSLSLLFQSKVSINNNDGCLPVHTITVVPVTYLHLSPNQSINLAVPTVGQGTVVVWMKRVRKVPSSRSPHCHDNETKDQQKKTSE